jgi:NADPH:quinone reductase-like Zn-dependent oxidoreductase
MRALRLSDSADAPRLMADDVPQPGPLPGQILVRVDAVGVTPTEVAWLPTFQAKDGGKRHRAILGHEFSGVVAALGDGVRGFEIGQNVYGMNDWFADGAMADYCLTDATSIAPKPPHLTPAEAASVPIGALTAWQGLFDRAGLRDGERVLVHGGAGAVGVYAVQLARWRGAHVTATASAHNVDFVARLGAERVIDHHATRFEDEVSGMDVVFDVVGGETLERSWGVLAPGGRMVTVAADGETATDERVKRAFFIVEASREQLVRVGELLASGTLQPVVDVVVPLAEAAAVLGREVAGGRGRGKRVVTIH